MLMGFLLPAFFMSQPDPDSSIYLGAFVTTTLLVSWTIALVTIGDTVPAYTTPLIMVVPAVVTLALRRIQGDSIIQTIKTSVSGTTGPALLFAVIYPVLFIGVAALVALSSGLGTYQPGADNAISQVIKQSGIALVPVFIVLNMALMYGEELGWRGYLLPQLTARWGRVSATAAVGVVWGLYHSAFLYTAATVLGVANPLLVTVVQASAVFVVSFPFAYAYYLTDGSVLPVAILHLIWNILNPWILGDIYGNVQGLVAGQIFVVNGEGVLGVMLGLVAAGGFVLLFKRGYRIHSS